MEKKTLRDHFLENTTHSHHGSQPVVHPDLPSSSQPNTSPLAFTAHDNVSEAGEPPSSNAATIINNVTDDQLQGMPSSSSDSKASYLTNNILTAAHAVDTKDVDAEVDRLIEYIIDLLEQIKEKKTVKKPSKTEGAKHSWHSSSESLKKFREVLSGAINVFKDVFPGEAKTVTQGLLKGMGAAHLTTTGFLIAAHVLERFETVSSNRDNCLLVLDEICNVAQHVKKLRRRDGLREGMERSIKEAMGLIVEASIMCSTQIGSSKGWRFLAASGNKKKLEDLQQRLQRMYRHMDSEVTICLYDATDSRKARPQKPRERPYPDYAVGIQKPLEEVLELLEWDSEENAVAVIVHGFGGMGKTTLADALFAVHDREGCKYSTVRLYDDVTSTSNIIKLQEYIVEDLKMGMGKPDIRKFEDGQRQIGHILQEEEAFIYIDNVVDRRHFEQLLPKYMDKAKKLRLLITTRDSDVCRGFMKLKSKIYPMKGLPEEEAKSLLKRDMDSENQLSSSQLDEIVKMCGYIPKLLTVVAGFISCADDKQKAYRRLKEEREKNWKGEIGDDIAHYVFAYQTLDERLKDPFLDICSFFNGRDWSEVEHIVGDGELNSLEKRALVTNRYKLVWVHDVILAMGHQQARGTRLILTNAKQSQEFLNEMEDEDFRKIKGIMLPYKEPYMEPVIALPSRLEDSLYISASKLDLASSSLRFLQLQSYAKVEGKCKKTFQKLVFLVARISEFPFDVSRSKALEYLQWIPGDLDQELTLSRRKYVEELLGSISKLQYLRVFELHQCKNLRQLPKDFGALNSLQKLHFNRCSNLEALPSSLGNLSSLQELSLHECSSLEALPSSLGNLSSLQKLGLYMCSSLEALPSSLGNLSSLQVLSLSSCNRLKALPSSLGKLSSLRSLVLQRCESLKDLPYELGNLSYLGELDLYGCKELSSIPESVGRLKSLKSLIQLSGTCIKELPDGFCNLSFITHLFMKCCHCLEKLPGRFGELTGLRELSLRYCKRLKKLPDSFGQLNNLEELDLSECTMLEELCIGFSCLSSLQRLYLNGCKMLKKLPEDFHRLSSVESLDLRDCHMLEGKWMESMVNMKTLQIVKIRGSPMLKERWEEIQRQGDHSWSFAVFTGKGSSNKESKKHILKQLTSKIDSILTNGRLSDLPPNTLLLVMFNGWSYNYPGFAPSLIKENIDDIPTNFKMIYFGHCFNELPKKMADRILGHSPANSNAQALFQKVLAAFGLEQNSRSFEMLAKIVNDEKGVKYLSCWELLSEKSVEELVMKQCGRYHKLKHLVEKPEESNLELLRELFASGEEESTLGFLKNDASEVRVEALEGKTILLDIRPANTRCEILPLQSLMEMYVAQKERLDFEIITIPIMRKGTTGTTLEFEEILRQVPWLVLQNPWQLKSIIKFFLVEDCAAWLNENKVAWDSWHQGIMRVIESNGRIAGHNPALLRMVNTWQAKAYPFTEEKRKELEEEERNQIKAVSNLEFLFRDQVKEVMFKGKMICFYTTSEAGVAGFIRNALIELRDNIHVIYIPQFKLSGRRWYTVSFTNNIGAVKSLLEKPEIPQIEMQEMSVLNLSEDQAMAFWARISSLKECINEMDDNDKHLDGIKKLLDFIDQGYSSMTRNFHDSMIRNFHDSMTRNFHYSSGYSCLGIMDEDGKLVTILGKEILKSPKDKIKELIQQLIKCPKECRKETLVELEQLPL